MDMEEPNLKHINMH